jgi:hypothetical protein
MICNTMNSPGIYFEITQTSLKALHGESGLELPLERTRDGRLTEDCRTRTAAAIKEFVQLKSWQTRQRGYCAISARGVSLRRLTVPSVSKEEFHRLLLMQIENEFPLSPDELAWGHQILGEIRLNGTVKQEFLVVAVKKEVIGEYAALFSESGIVPVFTLAALARSALAAKPSASYAILDVGEQSSELVLFEDGVPVNVRTVASSGEGLTSLAKALNGSWPGKRLLVAGSESSFKSVATSLAENFGSGIECEPLNASSGPGQSAATLGLKRAIEAGEPKLLFLQTRQGNSKAGTGSPTPLKWAAIAAILLAGVLLLPYAEALMMKPRLEKRLSALKADEGRLEIINKELGFLQHLKQSQPPYLDALYLFSKSAPSGAKIESLTMNRRGDVSLRGTLRNAEQVADFRNKLIASGFFSSVAVEEQTPTQDKQKLNIRITAQWKSASVLQTLAIGPTPEEIEKAKNKKDSPGGLPAGMPGGMPAGFPPGMIPPGAMPAGVPPGMIPSGARPAGLDPGTVPPGPMPAGMPPGVFISVPGQEAKE